jgi:two-component system nitrogen regulation response regulator NtrX
MTAHILIIDDEQDIRQLLTEILEDEGYRASQAAHSEAALSKIEKDKPSLIILDIWLDNSDMDGMEILEHVRGSYPEIPVIMISGHGNIEMAVKAMKLGAFEFVEKPFNSDHLLLLIERAVEANKLKSENITLKQRMDVFDDFTATDPTSLQVRQSIEKIAPTQSRVMIIGGSGSGKELVARQIHNLSDASTGPLEVLECSALSAESEQNQISHIDNTIEKARGGSCILKNVHDMSANTQAHMLQLVQMLQSEEGGSASVRLISTAHYSIRDHVKHGLFKEDLYYRLNVVSIDVPDLKSRRQDIAALARHYLKKFYKARGKNAPSLKDDALMALQQFNWPGNVRQLKNMVETVGLMHIEHDLDVLGVEHLPTDIRGFMVKNDKRQELQTNEQSADFNVLFYEWLSLPLKEARGLFEREYLAAHLRRFDGNIAQAAEHIGMERTALYRKVKTLGLEEDEPQDTQHKQRKA